MTSDASLLIYDNEVGEEPALKKAKLENVQLAELDTFMLEMENHFQPGSLNLELETAIASCANTIEKVGSQPETSASSTDASPYTNLFDAVEPSESVSSEDAPSETKPQENKNENKVNPATVLELKASMASTSRLIGTFTVLRATYLKLCKEFNYLLGKFNANERIKIELIHENNQLRSLLYESIKERELDRKKYKADLEALKAR